MKHYRFTAGWVIGMILHVIFFPIILDKDPLSSNIWWIGQLSGLTISIIVWIYRDRVEFKRLFNMISSYVLNWFKS